MSAKTNLFVLSIFCLCAQGCSLDTEGAFTMAEDTDAADQAVPDAPVDAGSDETNVPDVTEDISPDSSLDALPEADVVPDVVADTADESDSPEDVIDDVSPDAIQDAAPDAEDAADVIETDSPLDSPVDSPEADALEPVECFGVPTEAGNVMICAELPNGTGKSLMIKAGLDYPDGSGLTDVPFKSVCWTVVGVGDLACFPCPGDSVCWPVPDGGLDHSPALAGTVVKFQPGIADYPGGSMKNTLCNLGKCHQGRYTLYSGHAPICSVETDGTITGGTYEGGGTDIKIVCQL